MKKEKRKMNCVICKKPFTTKEWIEEKGRCKGMKIIGTAYCSKKCEKKFYDTIKEHERENTIKGLRNLIKSIQQDIKDLEKVSN